MHEGQELLDTLLDPRLERWQPTGMAEWFKVFKQSTERFDKSIDKALLGGRMSQCVGFAFSAGYQSAIESLFGLEEPVMASLCVTEAEGNHPRAIKSRLFEDDGKLFISGRKNFISGAEHAGLMYVACRDERFGEGLDAQGRPIIKVLKIPTKAAGVSIETMPALGFIPEVSHGRVWLDAVALEAEQVLSGDGYLNYVKAFRSYEDLHVLASIAAYRLGEAVDSAWGKGFIEQHLAVILALRELASMPLDSAVAHIALSACRSQLMTLIEASDSMFEEKNAEGFQSWQRDKVLLKVASKAHKARTERAWNFFNR